MLYLCPLCPEVSHFIKIRINSCQPLYIFYQDMLWYKDITVVDLYFYSATFTHMLIDVCLYALYTYFCFINLVYLTSKGLVYLHVIFLLSCCRFYLINLIIYPRQHEHIHAITNIVRCSTVLVSGWRSHWFSGLRMPPFCRTINQWFPFLRFLFLNFTFAFFSCLCFAAFLSILCVRFHLLKFFVFVLISYVLFSNSPTITVSLFVAAVAEARTSSSDHSNFVLRSLNFSFLPFSVHPIFWLPSYYIWSLWLTCLQKENQLQWQVASEDLHQTEQNRLFCIWQEVSIRVPGISRTQMARDYHPGPLRKTPWLRVTDLPTLTQSKPSSIALSHKSGECMHIVIRLNKLLFFLSYLIFPQ